MEKISRYRIPLLTAVGAVFAIVVFAAWISPEGGKLSSLHAQQTQLLSQQTHLQNELSTLERDKAHLASNCQELTTDLTEIPGNPPWTTSSTRSPISPWLPATPTRRVSAWPRRRAGTSGVKIVTVDMTLTGTYGQMSAFLHGLGSFPGFFTVNSISVNGGPVVVGGSAINAATAGYTLTLGGSIFYSTGQSNVCADATTTAAP